MARSKYGQSFQDAHDARRAKLKPIRKAAKKKFEQHKDISQYDSATRGGKNFGSRDIKYLQDQGFSNKQIKDHVKSLGGVGLSEGMRLNNKKFAGDYYTGDTKHENIADYDVGKGFNMANVKQMQRHGFSDDEIAKHANYMVLEEGKRHGNAMSKFMEDQGQLNYFHGDWKKAKEKAQAHQEQNPVDDPAVEPPEFSLPEVPGSDGGTEIGGDVIGDGNFGVGGGPNQNIGKQGDMTTTIGDGNTFGAGTSIGNDYSVTIGSQNGGSGLSNMQSVAAYSALNNNAWAKSRSQLNGFGRAAGASEEAGKTTGATDRVAALYNLTGQDQKYWMNKSTKQQAGYLGDIFKFKAPNWVMPPDPSKPEDNTEEIANSFKP